MNPHYPFVAERAGHRCEYCQAPEAIEQGSGNVFADLGYPNAEEVLTKARLAQRITEILERKRLTQIQAAKLLGVNQPKVSKLLRGQL